MANIVSERSPSSWDYCKSHANTIDKYLVGTLIVVMCNSVPMRSAMVAVCCLFLLAHCDQHRSPRVRRRVVFSKNSKIFFRVNSKENVIPWVQIYAVGWAVRVNFDLPDTLQRRHQFFKRDIEDDLNKFENVAGYKGMSCVMSMLCQTMDVISSSKTCGLFCEIGKIVSSSSGAEMEFMMSLKDKCSIFGQMCSDNSNKEN